MNNRILLTEESIGLFAEHLLYQEDSINTVAQYRRSLQNLYRFLGEGRPLTQHALLEWKQNIVATRAVRTVNCMIAAINAYLEFVGALGMRLKTLRVQRKVFSEYELTEQEFRALVAQARRISDEQTAVLLIAMSGSGVRVSEVQFLTVEAARQRMATISLKGKTRHIPLGEKVCEELLRFAAKRHITSGPIFLGQHGQPLDRRRIWERMKKLCLGAGVDPKKVHPHALRHLFARLFYHMTQDIAKLADLLGHSSIETTRIYIMTSIREHRTILDRLADNLGAKKPPQRSGKQLLWT